MSAVFEIRRGSDVVIVGTGVAGLTAALAAAPRPVTLLTKTRFGVGGNSVHAQGGVAVALGPGDSPTLHAEDTVAAGAGLTDFRLAGELARGGPESVHRLIELGAAFDRRSDGKLALGREAAHRRRRILHANGDATGAEMVRALVEAVKLAAHVRVEEEAFAIDLAVQDGRVVGLLVRDSTGRLVFHVAPAVVFATGGCGRIYRFTTNPAEATADGLAMAARAGARLVDLEFMQFHPTALAVGGDPMPLLTEALRGEGAIVVDDAGHRFLADLHDLAELAPRDVVAAAIWRRLATGSRVFMDAREAVGERFPSRFPKVFELCREHGLDPREDLLPISPAAHYHMGGIRVDENGASSLEGLWACGEVASSGLHGANRLASNSLLEALVFGGRVGGQVREAMLVIPDLDRVEVALEALCLERAEMTSADRAALASEVRDLMWRDVGLERERAGLARAELELEDLAFRFDGGQGEARNLLTGARLITRAALLRQESRGSHQRLDHARRKPAWRRRFELLAPGYGPAPSIEIAAMPALEESVA